jgi:hypothetical protein
MKGREKFMCKFLVFVVVIMCAAVTASAQSQTNLKRYFEEKQVTLKLDIPAAKDDVLRQISYEYAASGSKKIGVVRVGSPTTYLKPGLTTKDVLQVLGEPGRISKSVEDGMVVMTYEFRRGGDRVLVADFVRDTLVRSRTETGEQIAQGTR